MNYYSKSLIFSQEISGSPGLVCPSLSAAMEAVQAPPHNTKIESVFIFGGEKVFEVSTELSLLKCGCCSCRKPCCLHSVIRSTSLKSYRNFQVMHSILQLTLVYFLLKSV